MQEECELHALAVLQDNTRVPIGTIQVRRRLLHSSFQPLFQPLMLTTIARTGSTWMTHVLGQHPQILAYRPFSYDPRVGSYWIHLLNQCAKPEHYLRQIYAPAPDEPPTETTVSPTLTMTIPGDQTEQLLEKTNIEALAAFGQQRIEAFYKQVAVVQRKADATCFIEKYLPYSPVSELVWELYPQAREIMLVRDFRDMIASILAFNDKRGYRAFGCENFATPEAYIESMQPLAQMMLHNWQQRSTHTCLVRYEDLIRQPPETLSSLLDYLGLDGSPELVATMVEQASVELDEMHQHRTSPHNEASIGRWKRDLSPSLQAACHQAFSDVLDVFGYPIDTSDE